MRDNSTLKWIVKKFWIIKIFVSGLKYILLALGFFSFGIILWVGGFVLFIMQLVGFWIFSDLFYTSLVKTLYFIISLMYEVKLTGQENIPESGPAMIVAHRKRIWDLPLMAYACFGRRKVKFVMKRIDWMDYLRPARDYIIPIKNRENISRGQTQQILEALEGDSSVLGVFLDKPQDSRRRDCHRDVLTIAEKADVPIIPLHIDFQPKNRNGWFSRPRNYFGREKVDLRVEQPISPEELNLEFNRDCNSCTDDTTH